jgi:Glycosyl hydrolase catalytic core/Alpha-L-arabinofuranosidase B (ABFB) domain
LQVTTPGFTDRYIVHLSGMGYTGVVSAASDEVLRAQATFKIVRGLADANCFSFEASSSAGSFLRHQNFRLKLDKTDDSVLFKNDATFCARAGLSGTGLSFEAKNMPGSYIRHRNAELWMAKVGGPNVWDSAGSFDQDVSWNIVDGFAGGTPPPPPPATGKALKGFGVTRFNGVNIALADLAPDWTYDWAPSPAAHGLLIPAATEFVPMIWSAGQATAANLEAVKAYKVLLGFNEPDSAGQANMTVEKAIAVWPKLVATGLRLGSPVPTRTSNRAGDWLGDFMAQAQSKNLRVDFIALHWYGGFGGNFDVKTNVKNLKGYLEATHKRFKKPIWLTEFALINFKKPGGPASAEIQAQFLKEAGAMINKLKYVERYSWWTGKNAPNSMYIDVKPTVVGLAFKALP